MPITRRTKHTQMFLRQYVFDIEQELVEHSDEHGVFYQGVAHTHVRSKNAPDEVVKAVAEALANPNIENYGALQTLLNREASP